MSECFKRFVNRIVRMLRLMFTMSVCRRFPRFVVVVMMIPWSQRERERNEVSQSITFIRLSFFTFFVVECHGGVCPGSAFIVVERSSNRILKHFCHKKEVLRELYRLHNISVCETFAPFSSSSSNFFDVGGNEVGRRGERVTKLKIICYCDVV